MPYGSEPRPTPQQPSGISQQSPYQPLPPPPQAHPTTITDPNTPTPHPGPSANALRIAEMERRYEQVTAQVRGHSQEVLAMRTPPARPRSTPTTQAESHDTAVATAAGPVQAGDFQFNPLTAVHGEFLPGAAGWRPDQRSRRVRAMERDRLRVEEADRNATAWAQQNPVAVAQSALNPDARTFTPVRGGHRGAGSSSRRSGGRRSGGGGRSSGGSRSSGGGRSHSWGSRDRGGPSRGPP
ncbi:MAG: hypothetical protein Q9216_003175 [Gyalolechia sp. 2 TL-2023]